MRQESMPRQFPFSMRKHCRLVAWTLVFTLLACLRALVWVVLLWYLKYTSTISCLQGFYLRQFYTISKQHAEQKGLNRPLRIRLLWPAFPT